MCLKVLVADYGMNVYYGGLYDLEERLRALRAIGYDGLERCPGGSDAELIENAAMFHRLGMSFATVSSPSVARTARWAAALGCTYIWADTPGRDLATLCRQVNEQARACSRWGVRVALHNHMGTPVETESELREFMDRCPESGLILDTAHLAAVGGDPVSIVRDLPDRIVQVHLKDWIAERDADVWYERGRFCELGAGNIGLDNAAVVTALRDVGYAGTLAVEQDTHLRDPLEDLALSREYLRGCDV